MVPRATEASSLAAQFWLTISVGRLHFGLVDSALTKLSEEDYVTPN